MKYLVGCFTNPQYGVLRVELIYQGQYFYEDFSAVNAKTNFRALRTWLKTHNVPVKVPVFTFNFFENMAQVLMIFSGVYLQPKLIDIGILYFDDDGLPNLEECCTKIGLEPSDTVQTYNQLVNIA